MYKNSYTILALITSAEQNKPCNRSAQYWLLQPSPPQPVLVTASLAENMEPGGAVEWEILTVVYLSACLQDVISKHKK